MTRDFIDFHNHLLPAIDDGSSDVDESFEMARILAEFGFGTVYCTPHMIKGAFENPPKRVRHDTAILQKMLDTVGISLRLVAGTEHYLDEYLVEQIPDALTIGPGRYLLVEVPFRAGGEMIPAMVSSLKQRRLLPLFAHPERCLAFQPPAKQEGMRGMFSYVMGRRKEPDLEGALVTSLKDNGCLFQGNLGSFAGVYGSEVKQRAITLLKQGVYDCIGSDAHRSQHLAAMLNGGLEVIVATVGEEAAYELFRAPRLREGAVSAGESV